MLTIEQRIAKAKSLWVVGLEAQASEDYQRVYQCYTQAHEDIMDCALLHQQVHQRLRQVNYKLGNYGEWITDWLLHLFAPLGVFELVSWFSKTDVFGSLLCKRAP